jgi:multidrug efflux system membrane fusion protein
MSDTEHSGKDMRRLAGNLRLIIIAASAAVVAGGCTSSKAAKPAPATPVRVAPVSRINAPVDIQASGVVEPMQTVAVTTQVSGTLLDVLFREGDFVRTGQPLFKIDPRPLQAAVDQATAGLARDEAQANAGARDDVRYKTLADEGYVSRSQSDQMHATALADAATVNADRAALRAARVNLGFATIRAPIAGRTGGLLVRRGNNVAPGSGPLVVINQLSPVLVRFPVLDQDFPALQSAVASHPLPVTAVGNDSTQASEQGKLSFLDNAVDSLTGTVTGKANFANSAQRLWPGELVYLTIELKVDRNVLAVPTPAILTGQQGTYVFVVDTTNKAQQRVVVAGMEVGDYTVITRGLNAGERVITDGQSRINPGGKVSITTTGTDTGATANVASETGAAGGANASGEVTEGRAGVAGTPGNGAAAGGAPLPGSVSPSTSTTPGSFAPSAPATQTTPAARGAAPTTSVPTTGVPTTGVPTTGVPTTGTPTTTAPTTGKPPTTGVPTTGGKPPATGATTTGGKPPTSGGGGASTR